MIIAREAEAIKKEFGKIRVKIELSNLNDEDSRTLIESLDHIASDFAKWVGGFQGLLEEKRATSYQD